MYEGKPVKASDWRQQEGDRGSTFNRIDADVRQEIEQFLHEVAKELERMGFADPVAAGAIDSVVKNAEGQDAIRVYVYESPPSPLGWYTPGNSCAKPLIFAKFGTNSFWAATSWQGNYALDFPVLRLVLQAVNCSS